MIVEIEFTSGLRFRLVCGNWWATREGYRFAKIQEVQTKKEKEAWLPALKVPPHADMSMKIPKGLLNVINPITD